AGSGTEVCPMSYGTNQGPFVCPVLSDPGVMLCAMPVTVRIDGLGELLDQQFSVASRGQLLSLGMKDTAMQWRVRPGGPWQALLPGVYLGLTGAPNLPQKQMAALLYAGAGSLITGPAALMHHGLRSPGMLETVDVLVPAGRRRRGRWRIPRGYWLMSGMSGRWWQMRYSATGAQWLSWLRSLARRRYGD